MMPFIPSRPCLLLELPGQRCAHLTSLPEALAPVVTQAGRVSSGTPVFWLDLQLLKSQLNLNGVHLLSDLQCLLGVRRSKAHIITFGQISKMLEHFYT